MKLDFSLYRLSKKCSDINFHENPSGGSRVVTYSTDGRTDEHDDVDSLAILRTRLRGKVVLNSLGGVEDSLLIFNFVTGWRSVVSLKRWPFEPLERTPVPTEYTSWSVWRFRGEKPRTDV
jgi:hypothetical protein